MIQATYDEAELKVELIRDEGDKRNLYYDTRKILTGLIGHNFGITQSVFIRDAVYNCDTAGCEAALDLHWPWWRKLSNVRQRVLMNMIFNLGSAGLDEFKNTLAFIEQGAYGRAAANMRISRWARQVGERAVRLANMMETNTT